MPEIKEQLLRFGYTQEWLDFGFLTEEALNAQVVQQKNNGESNFEHFRYSTFKSWIRGRTSASDEDISNFASLVINDPDKIMAGSALADLVDATWITDSQFEVLVKKFSEFGAWTEKRITRASILRELDKGNWSQELVERALAHKDRPIHERLILHPGLSRAHMEMLAKQGANKGIRARAEEALEGNRFRNG